MRQVSAAQKMILLFIIVGVTIVGPDPLHAADAPCRENPAFAELDFWLGDWEVRVEDRVVGTNRIEKILSGCALMEHWTAAGGGQGKSLFYYDAAREEWKQVWVTEDTTRPGGLKEKRLVEHLADGAVRFQGEVSHPEHGTYLDRTTLTPLAGDRVRQLIEISPDGGDSWRPVFDALYTRPGEASRAPACGPIRNVDRLPTDPVLLFGEIHGTDLSPAVFGDVVCHVGQEHGEVVVGLEVSRRERERIETFLASEGSGRDRQQLLAGDFWTDSYQDGRRSRAMLALVDTLRALRASGVGVEVVAFDPFPDVDPQDREEGMAKALLKTRRDHPGEPMAVLTGNFHARTKRISPRFLPLGARLEAAGLEVFPIDIRHAGGSAWICTPEECGPRTLQGAGQPRETPSLELFPQPEPTTGYRGALWLGEIEASPPAVESTDSTD